MLKKFLIFKTGMLAIKASLGVFLILFSMWQQTVAYAQALPVTPVANFVVNRAVGGIITRVAAARGFAANDPRILATMNAAGAQLSLVNTAATVAGVGFAVAGAPVWLGIAASLGVLAVGSAIIAGNSSISIVPGTPNVLAVSSPPPSMPTYVPPTGTLTTPAWAAVLAAGYTLYKSASCPSTNECWLLPAIPSGAGYTMAFGNVTVKNTDAQKFGSAYAIMNKPALNYAYMESLGVTYIWAYDSIVIGTDFAGALTYTLRIREARLGCALPACDPQYGLPNYDRFMTYPLINPGSMGLLSSSNLSTIYPSIPFDAAVQPVSDVSLAKLVDQAWKNAAAQPGYEGLPYTAVNPVTAAEVQPWTAANPQAVPKIADLLTPASNPLTQTVPISPTVSPGTTSPTPTPTPTGTADVNVVNTPNVNVTNQISVDLGPNPNTAAPGVPTPPTAQVIFQPFLDLVAPLINYQPPALAGECPRPVFHILGNEITMSSHCDIAENNRGAIQSIMLVVFLIGAVTIVFSA